MTLGVLVACAPLEREVELGRRVYGELRAALEPRGAVFSRLVVGYTVARREAERLASESEAVAVVPVTGGTDRIVYEAVRVVSGAGVRPIVYAHPRFNALASVREALAALRDEGVRPTIVYGELWEAASRLEPWLRAAKARRGLRGARVGAVGRPEPWLLTVKPASVYRERLGVEVVEVSWDELLEAARAADPGRVGELVGKLKGSLGRVLVSDDALEKAVRVYLALRGLVERYGLRAVAVEAHDMLVEELRDWGPYLAVSLLSDEGVPADYELDLDAVVTKLLAYLLTGKPSFMANVTDVDPGRGTAVFSHCTVPLSMVDPGRSALVTYFETGRSVAVQGALRDGSRVTFARIGGAKLDRMLVGTGTIVNGSLGRSDLCRTQALVRVDGDPMRLVTESPGNHVVLLYGDPAEEFRAFAELAGMEVVTV